MQLGAKLGVEKEAEAGGGGAPRLEAHSQQAQS